jgi:GNAT superfamily N-acetyltransferase
MNYLITIGEKHHIRTIAEFQLKMAKETEDLKLDLETVLKGVTAVFDKPELGQYFVVSSNNSMVASLLITYEWSDWRNAMVWWIQSVYVAPEHRRKGVFSLMYSHVKSLVLKDEHTGGLRLYVDKVNKNAQKTYKNVGMNGEHYQLFEWMKE